jgi:uncharacterized protein (DUF305 family)
MVNDFMPSQALKAGRLAVLSVILGLTMMLFIGGCSNSQDSQETATSTANSPAGSESATLHNRADVAFVTGMIPHHQEAVEMSDLILAQPVSAAGSNAEVRALAQQIADAQAPEVEQMKTWVKDWGMEDTATDDGGMNMGGGEMDGHEMDGADMDGADMSGADAGGAAMNGMMTEAQMNELSQATGAELDQLYLELMITHHEGAIEMAQTELKEGKNPAALKLAQGVIDTQQAEIKQMQALLTAGR